MASVVSIEIVPSVADIYLGDTLQFQALALLSNGLVEDITNSVAWTLSDTPIKIAEFSAITSGLLYSFIKGIDTVSISALDINFQNEDVNFHSDDINDSITATPVNINIHNPLIVPQVQDLVERYLPTIDDYLKLVTSQYQNSPKMLEWIRTYLEITDDIKDIAQSMNNYFSFSKLIDWTTNYIENSLTVKSGDFDFVTFECCEGDQLDILGIILGQSRKVYFKANNITSPPTTAASVILGDDDYRLLLKNKIILNHWDGKASILQVNWENLFPSGRIIVQDNQNMTVDITIPGALSDTLINLIANDYVIPRSQGVLYNFYYGDIPFFGFDRDDDYVAGFDIGHWV
jgi:hypothetical protein